MRLSKEILKREVKKNTIRGKENEEAG